VQFSLATNLLLALVLASTRAAAWLVVSPPFNNRGLPGQAKALLAMAIALPLTPRLATQVPSGVAFGSLLAMAVEQLVVGVALGFITSLLFSAFQSAGNLIDLFGGFSLAFAIDPFSYQGNAIFGRFYTITASTLLFATDAHQVVLRGFTQSYKAIPLDAAISLGRLNQTLADGTATMFVAALEIAGPLIAVLFATDIALGLLSRAAPALNAFGLGFPAKILLTLSIAGTAVMLLPNALETLTGKVLDSYAALFG